MDEAHELRGGEQPDFQAIFESLPGAYLILDACVPGFVIVAVSDDYLQATMTQREAILGRGLFDVFPDNPSDPSGGTNNLRASLERVLANGLADTMAIQKYDIRRPESQGGGFEERHWSPVNSPVRSRDGTIRYIAHQVEDVTELVKARQQGIEHMRESADLRARIDQNESMRQAQRMEAMGQLAGGIAHDFNNILTAILLNCDHLVGHPQMPPALSERTAEIRTASQSAAALVRQLLAFSRKQVLQPQVLNLNTVVESMRGMLDRVLAANLTLALKLDPHLGNTKIDVGQVEQILLNLVVNARDAMPDGGSITIETANVDWDAAIAGGTPKAEPGPYVMLAVRDTGLGMTPSTQARLFEPFFTTKGVGRGTGLGLATVYGIVSQNKGTIWVYSEIRRGSVFKVFLPRVAAAVAAPVSRPVMGSEIAGGTILVVEDHGNLRSLIARALEGGGFRVHTAANGKEALRVIADIGPAVDLVVTDMMMPEMSGRALADRLTATRPGQRILFLSGYSEDSIAPSAQGSPVHFLEKPFSLRDLLAKVRSTLASAPG